MFSLRTYFFVFIFLAISSMSQEASALDNAINIHQVDTVWDYGYTGEGISIAVLDTGIDPNHVSLNDFDDDPDDPKIIAFYDAFDDEDDGSGNTQAYDDHGHGSHVAGIIAGTGGENEQLYRGVAPGANLIGVKVLDSGGSSSFTALERGMQWTIDNKIKYNIRVAYVLDPTTLSDQIDLTSTQQNHLLGVLENMEDNGISIIVPAGNSFGMAHGAIGLLGSSQNVITVGSTGANKDLAVYSNKGPTHEGQIKPNIAAIGSGIISVEASSGDNYSTKSGTSMSAGIVAGISALLYESNPDLSPDEIRIILESTSEYRWLNHPVRPNNDYGWGFVNAADALQYATSISKLTIAPSYQGSLDTVNYTREETEGWNLTSSRYQAVVGTGIYFDLLNTDELVVCDLEIDFSEIVEGSDYCEENPYFFYEPGNFSFIVRMWVYDLDDDDNSSYTHPFYFHINVVENYLDYNIYSSPSHSICNIGVINFTAVNNGNFHDTAQFRISNIQELEDAGFILALPASQYIIESGGEQLISVSVYSSEVVNVEKNYSLVLNVSTTLEGWNDSAESSTIMNFEGCSVESNGEEEEIKIPGMPTAIAGQDVSIETGGTVQFSGAGTDDDGIIVKYEWDFDGDGVYEWSSNENGLTTFLFNNAGTYTATLRVTDNDGKTATDSLKVTVKSPEEEGLLPSLSLLSVIATIGLLAIFRRKN